MRPTRSVALLDTFNPTHVQKWHYLFSGKKHYIWAFLLQICIQMRKTPFLFIIHTLVHNLDYSLSRRHHDTTWPEYNTMAHFHDVIQPWKQWRWLAFARWPPPKRHWPQPQRSLPPTHLFIHEDIDDWVDDRTRLGQDWRDDARLRCDQARRTEGGQQGHDAVRQPAQQVADHHNHHHE